MNLASNYEDLRPTTADFWKGNNAAAGQAKDCLNILFVLFTTTICKYNLRIVFFWWVGVNASLSEEILKVFIQ